VQQFFESGADYLEIFDEEHSEFEDRFIAIGPIDRGLVVVVYKEREEKVIRIIGACLATKREQALEIPELACVERQDERATTVAVDRLDGPVVDPGTVDEIHQNDLGFSAKPALGFLRTTHRICSNSALRERVQEAVMRLRNGAQKKDLTAADVVHATPPCQELSSSIRALSRQS
jgi:hypothetical protein